MHKIEEFQRDLYDLVVKLHQTFNWGDFHFELQFAICGNGKAHVLTGFRVSENRIMDNTVSLTTQAISFDTQFVEFGAMIVTSTSQLE